MSYIPAVDSLPIIGEQIHFLLFCAYLNLIIAVHVRRRNVKPIYKKNLKGIDVYNLAFIKLN